MVDGQKPVPREPWSFPLSDSLLWRIDNMDLEDTLAICLPPSFLGTSINTEEYLE